MVDAAIVERFESVLWKGEQLERSHTIQRERGVYLEPQRFNAWRSQAIALLGTVYSEKHPYTLHFIERTTLAEGQLLAQVERVQSGMGILQAANEDYANGYVWTLRERVHADLFDDFLEMAASLTGDGYTHAAAVLAGSTLEEHLRKLCEKNGISVTVARPNGAVEPKRASAMNEDLRRESIYTQPQWRFVQAWLDIRNNAAHGNYNEYSAEQVAQMIEGIRSLVVHYPA